MQPETNGLSVSEALSFLQEAIVELLKKVDDQERRIRELNERLGWLSSAP